MDESSAEQPQVPGASVVEVVAVVSVVVVSVVVDVKFLSRATSSQASHNAGHVRVTLRPSSTAPQSLAAKFWQSAGSSSR